MSELSTSTPGIPVSLFTPVAQSNTNQDVWREILLYFRISLANDCQDDVKSKRSVLLSIALTCSELVEIALDELWRSMVTLEPVLGVFGDQPSIVLRSFLGMAYWVLDRVRSYLRRIRSLHFEEFPSYEELALWQTLSAVTRLPVICPALAELWLDLAGDNNSGGPCVFLLLSSSLRSITLAGATLDSYPCIHMILSIIRSNGTQLLDVRCDGTMSSGVFHQITQFPSLHSLILQSPPSGDRLEEAELSPLDLLQNLTVIEMDIDMVSEAAEASLGRRLAGLQNLISLTLHGTRREIDNCFSSNLLFRSVEHLLLKLGGNQETDGEFLFPRLLVLFPNIHSLGLVVKEDDNESILHSIEDILVLKTRPMKRLHLDHVWNGFDVADFVTLLSTWPQLEELSLASSKRANDDYFLEAEPILSHIATNAPHLTDLGLPLEFSSLGSSLVTHSPSLLRCPLKNLVLHSKTTVPENMKEKLIVARNLISLFPRLTSVQEPHINTVAEKSGIEDLQEIISSFRALLSSPPGRPNHLFLS
ncbi:hypothetical protein AN958_08336 [Leucoagaricus sp. SymC.cos]|nr:hypothetical protein AN958_08336 [Leucoagaricus sp. SymC.cos]